MADGITKEEMRDVMKEFSSNFKPNGGGNSAGIPSTTGMNLGGDNILNKSLNLLGDGFSKLASGTLNTSDAINLVGKTLGTLPGVGNALENNFKALGGGVIDVYRAMQQTGKVGVTLGGDLGLFNESIKKAQLTIPEFNEIIQQSSTKIAGLGADMDKSASAYLDVLKGVQESPAAEQLKAAGMSAKEFADITQLSMINKRNFDIKDAAARQEAINSTIQMAQEMDIVSKITGKSRKEQQDAIQTQMQQAAVVAKSVRMGDKWSKDFEETQAQIGNKWGKSVQDLISVTSVGAGAPQTQEQRELYAALGGDVQDAMRKLSEATDSGDKARIEAARDELDIKLASRATDKEFARIIENTGFSNNSMTQNMAKTFQEMNVAGKSFAQSQKELEKQVGRSVTPKEVLDYQINQAELKQKGLQTEGPDKGKVNEAAAVSRTIGYIDNLGKVAGGVVAEGFTTLNKKIGAVANEGGGLDQFEKKLIKLGSGEGMKEGVADFGKSATNAVTDAAKKLGKSLGVDETGKKLPADYTGAHPTRDSGTLGMTGGIFEPKDFIGKVQKGETVFTSDQLKNLVTNTAKSSIEGVRQSSPVGMGTANDTELKALRDAALTNTKELMNDQLSMIKEVNDAKVADEKESGTEVSDFLVVKHTSTMKGMNDMFELIDMVSRESRMYNSEDEAKTGLAKIIGPDGLKISSNENTELTNKLTEIVGTNPIPESEVFKPKDITDLVRGILPSTGNPMSGNVTYQDIPESERAEMHAKHLAEMNSPEGKAEIDLAVQAYRDRIQNSGMYKTDSVNKTTPDKPEFEKSLKSDINGFLSSMQQNFGPNAVKIKQPDVHAISNKEIATEVKKQVQSQQDKEHAESKKTESTPQATIQQVTLKDIKDELVQLNMNIKRLVQHSADTADSAAKQIRVTKGLSGNRFA